MAFAYVKGVSQTSTAADPTPTFGSAVSAGSLLVASVYWNSTIAQAYTCSVSDSVNGAWTAVGSPLDGTVGEGLEGLRIQMFYFLSSAAGTPTVTADISTNVNAGCAVQEFTGTSIAFDAAATYNNHNNTTTPTTNSLTTSVTDGLLVAMSITSFGTQTAGAGYVIPGSPALDDFGGNAVEYNLTGGSPGSKTASFTDTDVFDHMLGFVAFKEGTSGKTGKGIAGA